LSDDGSGKGAALIAIVADRFQKSQLRSMPSIDENEEDEEVRAQFQRNLSKPTSPIPLSPTTTTVTRTLP
jgi:hypothetical protein